MAQRACSFKWVFGRDEAAKAPDGSGLSPGASANVMPGSTGSGTAFNTHGWGTDFTWYIESTDSASNYQIRAGRTSSGPWAVLSSGAIATTNATVVYQHKGPHRWLSPRIDVMASSVNTTVIQMVATEP